MCGIVGGITNKNITPLLLEGLNRLEYRGYDSSGLVVLSKTILLIEPDQLVRLKILKKI